MKIPNIKICYDKSAIEEYVTSYSLAAKRLSYIYHHRPVPPGAELVHWVEHVIQTQGAPHLRSLTLMVPWYQQWFLDVAIVAIVIQILLFIMMKRLVMKMKSVFNTRQKNSKKVL